MRRSIARMARRFAVAILVAVSVACCGVAGISQDRAIELARAASGDSSVSPTIVSAESGTLDRFVDARTLPVERRDRLVWAVVVSGAFGGECVMNANGESVCPTGATRKVVVLEFITGDLILTESR